LIVGKGKGVTMLKDSNTRKRKREEIEEVKEEETKLKQDKGLFLRECKRMKFDFSEMENEVMRLRKEAEVPSPQMKKVVLEVIPPQHLQG
jgi:hypothetical protein